MRSGGKEIKAGLTTSAALLNTRTICPSVVQARAINSMLFNFTESAVYDETVVTLSDATVSRVSGYPAGGVYGFVLSV